jgi:hypothetical protein
MTPTIFRARQLALWTAVLAIALTLSFAATARAGQWAQVTCSDGGESVPTEGWAHGSFEGYPDNVGQADTCQQAGGSLSLRDEGTVDQLPDRGPMWVYTTPAYSTIVGGTMKLSLASPGGQAWVATPANETTSENLLVMCIELCTTVKEATVPVYQLGGTQLFAVTECLPPSGKSVCASALDAQMNITTATILLSNEAKPAGAGFAGTLLNNPASGAASLSFTAHDEHGPGVYRATVQIDGHTLWSATPNLNEGKCVAHGSYNGALKFHNLQPCPQETTVHTEIQTSELAEGVHTLKVEIEDAAENKATVYTGPITIDNQPPTVTLPIISIVPPSRGAPNGEPAPEHATFALASKQPKAFAREQTRSAVALTGRLTASTGTPVKGAQIELLQQATGSAGATPIASATTRPDGTWRLNAPAGPSRVLRIVYYSHTLDSTPAAALDLHEEVQGAVSMHAPSRARLGRALVFRGQLAGGYVPRGGEYVQMEILYAGRWRTIEVLRTSSQGAWTYRYVFTIGVGASYLFRAVTVPNGAYPFSSTHTKPVRVTVER